MDLYGVYISFYRAQPGLQMRKVQKKITGDWVQWIVWDGASVA